VINNINNSVESISLLNKEEVDKSNYKQMLDVYRIIKEQYKNDNVTIDFYGVDDKSTMKILYEKELGKNNNTDIKVETSENVIDLCKQLNDICEKFNNKQEQITNQRAIFDKHQDLLLHKLENLKKKNIYELNDQEKENILQIAINIQDIRLQRRETKDEQRVLQSMKDKKFINKLNQLNKQMNVFCSNKFDQLNQVKQHCRQGKINKSMEYKEIPYKDFKERINIMKQMQQRFEQVRYDENKKIVFCYNNCKG
jgi:hypothetical protein